MREHPLILMTLASGLAGLFCAAGCASGTSSEGGDSFRSVPLQSHITHVQPMTGIVMWEDSENSRTDAISLEYSYLRYDEVVKARGQYDWSAVERKLDSAASRKHQAILRFYETWPGRETTVPAYIKALPDYQERRGSSEGRETSYPDWSHPEYQRFFLEFYERFAAKYDRDPRLAFLEVGFGLWAEYHIYSGPEVLGKTFPSKEFQAQFFRHLSQVFQETPWMISQDAHEAHRAPFADEPELLDLGFGLFDDSFHQAWRPGYNLEGWGFFGRDRWQHSPCGGEIVIRNRERSGQVGEAWAREAANFHITFMICEGWPRRTTMDRIREHSLACGYRFGIIAFEVSPRAARVTVRNTGVAPIYYDAFVAVNGVRAEDSLKGLLPGEDRRFTVASGGAAPRLTIECDRLVPGQRIEFEAFLGTPDRIRGQLGRTREDSLRNQLAFSVRAPAIGLSEVASSALANGDLAGAGTRAVGVATDREEVVKLDPLPKGISTWVYRFSEGVSRQVRAFNFQALPHLRFKYLFPYGGSVGFGGQPDGQAAVSYGSKTVSAYAETLPPGMLIMPIVDGRADKGEFSGWTDEQYREAARKVAEHIIADPHAAGVQIDIEPFRPDHLPFYRHLTEMLNAKGKYCTMFVGPRRHDLLTGVFQSCNVVVMSGYDLNGEGMELDAYRASMKGSVARFQQVAEETGGQYMIGIPAAASWGEFEYTAGGDAGRVETGVKQEEYVQAALDAVKPYHECPEYIGLSLWHMSDPEKDFEEPEKATRRTKFPNIIRESVWKMLEDY